MHVAEDIKEEPEPKEESKVEEDDIVGPFNKLKSDNLHMITHASGKVKFNRLAQKEVQKGSDDDDKMIGFQAICEDDDLLEEKVTE